MSFHSRYLSLVGEIERNFPVVAWTCEDFEIWPLARMQLYLDMYWAQSGTSAPSARKFPVRSVLLAARLARNAWLSRNDLRRWALSCRPAHAVFLGDGVSLDHAASGTIDRFGEPIVLALEAEGKSSFMVQPGDLSRFSWGRRTYAANLIHHRGSPGVFGVDSAIHAPGIEDVAQFLKHREVHAASMNSKSLAPLASRVSRTAAAFERMLRKVKPSLAFVTNYYSNLGPAFMLACRRQRVLSIDLQHCPHEGTHQAYEFARLPVRGYPTLPAVFWNWTETDAANIRRWTDTLAAPWHRSLYAGHSQVASFSTGDANAQAWNEQWQAVGGGATFDREILVAIQPVGNYRNTWESLARQIEAAPPTWRWWIRRHPASTVQQDAEYLPVLSLRKPNVLIAEASAFPLPALLRKATVVVSLFSGAAVEAAMFGVPALFLSEEAGPRYSDLIRQGTARVIDCETLTPHIAELPRRPAARQWLKQPPSIESTVARLEGMAVEYRRLGGL
jgi:hypothetical protein